MATHLISLRIAINRLMTEKPREKTHVIYLTCLVCGETHRNTRNAVLVTTTNPYKPVEDQMIWSLSNGRTPFGLNYAPTNSERFRIFNTTGNSNNIEHMSLEDNGMEALELDTPTEVTNNTSRPPSLETLPSYLLD